MPRSESCSSVHRRSLAGALLVAATLLASLPSVAFAQANPSCELRILGESDAAEAYEDVRATLVEPGRSQRRVIAEAAPYLTPLHCRAVDDIEVTMGRHAASGRTVFQLEGSGRAAFGGEEHPAELVVRLDLADGDEPIERVSWPRGIYRLGTGANSVSLMLDGARAGSFVASHGFVLVTTATADRIEGSIVLQRADRPFAPMGVPYAAGDLPRITFRVDGR